MVKQLYILYYFFIFLFAKCDNIELKYNDKRSQEIYNIILNVNDTKYKLDCNEEYNFKECFDISKQIENDLNINQLNEIELLAQTDKIKPQWCACGIRSLAPSEEQIATEIFITNDSVKLADNNVPAIIKENGDWFK